MVTIGIDEAGRGCWAGPLVAAAVYFPTNQQPPPGLDDCKRLSPIRRQQLFQLLAKKARIGIGWSSPQLIDEKNLNLAQTKAMGQALSKLSPLPDSNRIIVDGSINYLAYQPNSHSQIGADGDVPEVMAASVVAKVTRDRFCQLLDRLYPGWGLAQHKGYGTPQHQQLLERQTAVVGLHRFSYRPIAEAITRSIK